MSVRMKKLPSIKKNFWSGRMVRSTRTNEPSSE
jgi:hypothetical protein